MKRAWNRKGACALFTISVLWVGGAFADQRSDMEQHRMDCAKTTASNKLGECLAAKGAPAVSATESHAEIHAAVVKCA